MEIDASYEIIRKDAFIVRTNRILENMTNRYSFLESPNPSLYNILNKRQAKPFPQARFKR